MTAPLDAELVPTPPEGFVSSTRGPFTSHNGPMFHRRTEQSLQHAFFVLPRHCNSVGIVHGGMLATFMDGVLAGGVARATGATPITVHLSLDYLAMARAGEWVYGEAVVTRQTRDLVFVEGRIWSGDRDVLRGSAVFKPMKKKAE